MRDVHTLTRRRAVQGLASGAAALTLMPAARAQSFPDRPITVVVPNVPGGAADVIARQVGAELSKRLHQSVVIENLPGAGSVIAAQRVLRAPPDGYTLLLGNNDVVTTPATVKNAGFALRDFTPVVNLARIPLGLFARAGLAVTTIDDIVALAKAKPRSISVGVTGTTSIAAIAVAMLEAKAGIELQSVPYKGGAQAVTDLLGGQIDLVITTPSVGLPHARAGKAKLIGLLSEQRMATIPDAPTLHESRLVKGAVMEVWGGIFGPARMPASVTALLNKTVQEILRDPAFQEESRKRGDPPTVGVSSEEFARMLADEDKAIRAATANMKLE